MSTVVKIAFYDPDKDEFYSGEEHLRIIFSNDITKAKLYTGKGPDFTNSYQYVKNASKRNLICIDVEVSFNPIKVDNHAVSNTISKKIAKIRNEYDPLNIIADEDIDKLTEKDYQRWKKLRNQLRDLDEII